MTVPCILSHAINFDDFLPEANTVVISIPMFFMMSKDSKSTQLK